MEVTALGHSGRSSASEPECRGGGTQVSWKLAVGLCRRAANGSGIAWVLSRMRALRCVVFHDVSAASSPFTRGLGVSLAPAEFEAALRFLTRHYTPVSLDDVLASLSGRDLPPKALLVTFDDGYASAMNWAVPLCSEHRVPAVFFLSAAYLDNKRLSPDNLVCYVANVMGLAPINAAAREVKGRGAPNFRSRAEVSRVFFPSISTQERRVFLEALARFARIGEHQLAGEAGLYLTGNQVRELTALGFEVGNHTYSHVRCRSLTADAADEEIRKNKAELELLSGKRVRSFSVPYGSSADLSTQVVGFLEATGHQAIFLSESVANPKSADRCYFDRVSIHTGAEDQLSLDLEVLPRLRRIRNRLLRDRRRDLLRQPGVR